MMHSDRRIFNEYSWKRDLGAGAFGDVVLVERRDDSQIQYAAKLVQREDYLANVFREAAIQFAAQQVSPYVVPVVERRPEGVLLEFYEGGDILDAVRDMHQHDFLVDAALGVVERPDWTFCDNIAQQLLSAVTSLHLTNIFHFDIKPGNVLWKYDGSGDIQIGLADFGFAVESGEEVEVFHDRVGTLLYSAPENISPQGAQPTFTYKADVFSVGQTLFTIFTGRYLLTDVWTHEAADIDALCSMILEDCFDGMSMQEFIDSRLSEEVLRGKLRERDQEMLAEMLNVDPNVRSDVWTVLEKYYPDMYDATAKAKAELNAPDLNTACIEALAGNAERVHSQLEDGVLDAGSQRAADDFKN